MARTGGLTTRGGLNETTRVHIDRQRADVDTFADLEELTERCPAGHICYVIDEERHYKLRNDLVTWRPLTDAEAAELALAPLAFFSADINTGTTRWLLPPGASLNASNYQVFVRLGSSVPPTEPEPEPEPEPNPNPTTPAAPGVATTSGTTSTVPLVAGYNAASLYEAEPIFTNAPAPEPEPETPAPTPTAPAAPAAATSSGTTSSVPLVAGYADPSHYEAEPI